MRYVVYTHPGDSGSNRPAHVANKKKHEPYRLFHDSQKMTVRVLPLS